MDAVWREHLERTVAAQKAQDLDRRLVPVVSEDGPEAVVGGRKMLLFCSNDYLGFSKHPAIKEAAGQALERYGVGAGASRLVSGNLDLYGRLEEDAARFKHAESALVFATGFMTNLGVVAGLAGPYEVIVSDALNHASLVDACRLSRARVLVADHADAGSFARALKDAPAGRKLIVTDGVFSMDGDVAPLADLAELALKYGALLVVDDAHGTGVLGATGRGSLEHAGVDPEGIVQVSTFSKALGGLGGFVAGPGAVVEFLKNRSRPLFYSTGLPPAVLAGNTRALRLVDEEPETRERLLRNAARLRRGLTEAGFESIPGPSPIVPVMVGEAGRAVEMSRFLMEAGIFCPAIRPPTVPPGQCRLRFSLMAGHTFDQIDLAAALTVEAAGKAGVL